MRDIAKLTSLYEQLFEELGTADKMGNYHISAEAFAKVDLGYTEGYGDPSIKKDFPICFPAEGSSRRQIIEIKNMRFYTRCEHHGLPFIGYVHYFYIPDTLVCGLSKPARVVHHFAHKYQMQEKMTHEISEYLWQEVSPVAHVVSIEGMHLCNIMRGIETPDTITRTREQKVDELIYKEQKQEGALYHLIKDLCNHDVTGPTRGVNVL